MRPGSAIPRRSKVIPSDDEIAEQIRASNDGQPKNWIEDAVKAELSQRADLQAFAQRSYDQSAPRVYTPPKTE